MAANATRVKSFKVHINQAVYEFETEEVTGADLKAAAAIPATNLLFREVRGPDDDEPIADGQVVRLQRGDHFYDMPPGNFGCDDYAA